MKEPELSKFLGKVVKIRFDIGYGRTFLYVGEVTEVNTDNIQMTDRKIGQLLLGNSNILFICLEEDYDGKNN